MAQPAPIVTTIDLPGRVQVTASFEAQVSTGTGSDWSSGVNSYFIQVRERPAGAPSDGSLDIVTTSIAKGLTTTRAKYADLHTVAVDGGSTVTAGLVIAASLGFAVTAWDIDTRLEVIKR